ncbi:MULTISPECIES: hypothetical protein [Bradyrhizobium]|uniref:Uncharacterized protein n=1 Tax=Bradyrhizobium elkanii TaxID=29448 RepID=A0A8I1YI16_BRAEL|nr:hypothetical protein [Bradyrhizobium elkanii]MBP1299892.1 hypothetical protein [Bradyrhizobium elkanii]MCP1728830.1 hypothetical protein [Bradyrhizobium elkanii]MCS3572954.1 hypothetical protein [Bradyrhizobium elkanii]MCS3594353.1 hypothetical protein [Bradyrhizobium elkanii]MCS3623796.1 hypothetical protein [Bradyrhizobium elkanii]
MKPQWIDAIYGIIPSIRIEIDTAPSFRSGRFAGSTRDAPAASSFGLVARRVSYDFCLRMQGNGCFTVKKAHSECTGGANGQRFNGSTISNKARSG